MTDPTHYVIVTVPGLDLPDEARGVWFDFACMTSTETVFDRYADYVMVPTPMIVPRDDGATARVMIVGRRENLPGESVGRPDCPECSGTGITSRLDHHSQCPGGGHVCEALCPVQVPEACACRGATRLPAMGPREEPF